jgi:iron(II)-dependent oxidoreductase
MMTSTDRRTSTDGRTRERIARQLESARASTLSLFDLVPREADLHESPGFGFRPIIWHLAHIGVFEAYWILQKVKGDPAPDERYERIFDPISTPREQSKDLPTRREMENYLSRVRNRVLDFLHAARFDAFDSGDTGDALLRDGYIFRLVLEHERQHQETLAYLLQLLDPAKKSRPPHASNDDATAISSSTISSSSMSAMPEPSSTRTTLDVETARFSSTLNATTAAEAAARAMIEVPACEFEMGAIWDGVFAYDNELPPHAISLPAFKIDPTPVTNEEYARFIAEGGYERREFWDDEGWTWREREGWTQPLYWRHDSSLSSSSSSIASSSASSWRVRTMFGEESLPLEHPVTGVSWYEAEAYARFAGKRLPTEAEWERAASWDDARARKRLFAWGDAEPTTSICNFDLRFWGTTPVGAFPTGASACGCLDMTGNVWEWTSSKFAGYPDFRAFPYPEYSEVWFDEDHRVLRGGSWATSASLLRTSFRNFFRRHFRIAFAGLRCADDD